MYTCDGCSRPFTELFTFMYILPCEHTFCSKCATGLLAAIENPPCIRCGKRTYRMRRSITTAGVIDIRDNEAIESIQPELLDPFEWVVHNGCAADGHAWKRQKDGKISARAVRAINFDIYPAEHVEAILNKCAESWNLRKLLSLNLPPTQLNELIPKYLAKVKESALRQMNVEPNALSKDSIKNLSSENLAALIECCARANIAFADKPYTGNLIIVIAETESLRSRYEAMLIEVARDWWRENPLTQGHAYLLLDDIKFNKERYAAFDELCREADKLYQGAIDNALQTSTHARRQYFNIRIYLAYRCNLPEMRKEVLASAPFEYEAPPHLQVDLNEDEPLVWKELVEYTLYATFNNDVFRSSIDQRLA